MVVRKPRGSAMCGLHDRPVDVETLGLGVCLGGQDTLVVTRHDLGEALHGAVPLGEQAPGDGGVRLQPVTFDQGAQERAVVLVEVFEIHHRRVEPVGAQKKK